MPPIPDYSAATLQVLRQIQAALNAPAPIGQAYAAEIDVPATALTANLVDYDGGTVQIGLRFDFIITHLSSTSTGAYSFQWRESGSATWNSKNSIRSDVMFLGYQWAKLPRAYRITAGQNSIETLLTDLSGAGNAVHLAFIGYLVKPGT